MSVTVPHRRVELSLMRPVQPSAPLVCCNDGVVQCIVWNTKTSQPVHVVDVHNDLILCLAWNRDGSLFATTSRDGRIRLIEPRSGTVVSV